MVIGTIGKIPKSLGIRPHRKVDQSILLIVAWHQYILIFQTIIYVSLFCLVLESGHIPNHSFQIRKSCTTKQLLLLILCSCQQHCSPAEQCILATCSMSALVIQCLPFNPNQKTIISCLIFKDNEEPSRFFSGYLVSNSSYIA